MNENLVIWKIISAVFAISLAMIIDNHLRVIITKVFCSTC